ncbi:MAG TPA: PAS domain S-box protein [Opitutaceae bacterium]|nr:PAS domain S-box protein [Opitutaceae bacterium]
MRQALWIAFAFLLLAVTATLLIASYAGTRVLAQKQADLLMRSVQRETDSRLHRVFDPIRQKVTEDYASIRIGRYSTRDPAHLKDRLYTNLFSLQHVDSLMVGDLSGSQFLVMRYTPAVRNSPVLAPIAASLPAAPEGRALQFFTRDFRPAEWGETSRWTLWDEVGRTPLMSWELPLPGYDGRLRPWHRAALARFADMPLDEAHLAGADLIAWTEVYPLFTTRKPGISASVAARDPDGRLLIVAYDLLLDEIATFTRSARPTAHGQLLILTEDDRLLGPPQEEAPADATRATAAIMQPLAEAGFPLATHAAAVWREAHARTTSQFQVRFGGETWWAGFVPFNIGSGRLLWIAVLLPETDLVPAAQAHQRMILMVGAIALLIASGAAVLLARRLSTPLATLAEQARRIAALDLEPAPPVVAPVAELALLSETVVETRNSLREGIAAREKAIRALAEGEQQLRTLAENTLDVIVRLDCTGRYLFANPAHERATGMAAAAVLGRTLEEVGHPPERVEVWRRFIAETVATRKPVTFEFSYATPAGPRNFEARLLLEPATGEHGDTILGVFHDVTERTQAAAALARSQMRYRTLIEAALVGIIVHQDCVIRFANPAAHLLLGHERDEPLVDSSVWENYIAPAYREELNARSIAALRGEHPPLHPGWQLVRRDGSCRWVQSNVTSIEWDGRPALLSFIRDVTDLRAANERQAALEEQLRHSQKLEAVGLLAGGIAHDFNNLLQVIGGNAQFAETEGVSPQEQHECLREIARSVQRASQMTRQLLAFSRRQALAREHTDLNTFVADHIRMLRRVLPENIRIEVKPAARPLTVLADRGQLEQVLLNLCLNARDAMPRGGELTLSLATVVDSARAGKLGRPTEDPLAELRVADTGHGMDEATRDRIFDPFFTTKSRDKGTGLGLAVVYGIVHQHGGSIEVSSRPGEGATFTIHLPLQTESQPAPTAAETALRPAVPLSGTILLAEDNAPIRRVAVAALKHAGYTVHPVGDGIEAVEHFERHADSIDLLFFDVMMPRLSGFEAADRCRAVRPDVPVVFASGYAADSVEQHESIPAGAHVLAKPYRTEKLLELIAKLLAARRN